MSSDASTDSEVPFVHKVLGGRLAYRDEFPYQVQLQSPTGHFCSGVILATYMILTAAHCFDRHNYKRVKVVAGQYSLKTAVDDHDDGTEQYRKIEVLIKHSLYDMSTRSVENDIALLILNEELEFNNVTQSILVPTSDASFDSNAITSGWGVSEETNFDISKFLRQVDLTLHNDSVCDEFSDRYGNGFDSEIMLCAGGSGKDSCKGDSGGPLTCIHQSNQSDSSIKKYVCGITSAGPLCEHRSEMPGIYTKVSYYHDWIMNQTRNIRPQYNCPKNYFQCRNFMCIPKTSICDEFNDCADGSDEENCKRRCSSMESIKFDSIRCDGVTDCDNGLDEIDCGIRNVTLIANPECSPMLVECDPDFQCKLLSESLDNDESSILSISNLQIFVDGKEFRNDVLILLSE